MSTFRQCVRDLSRLAAAAFAALLLVPALGGGGVTGTGQVAWGIVEDFGSVFVNGIEFFTQGADIVIDGAHAQPESRLRIGMAVRVDGTVNADGKTGTAQSVRYSADLRGLVDGPATATADGARFFVHGVEVLVDERTVLDGLLGVGALAAGVRVEATGLRDAGTGLLRATFLTLSPIAPDTVVSGPVSLLSAGLFRLGDLTVTYDPSASPALAQGMVVRAASANPPLGGVLAASRVEVVAAAFSAAAGTVASATGVVRALNATGFSLGALPVLVTKATKFRNGTASDLADGDLVEAEGEIQASGALLASRVTFPAPESASAEAVVASRTASAFVLAVGPGINVQMSNQTRFKDRTSARVGGFDSKLLRVGDRVSVSGGEIAPGTILADSVSKVDAAPTVQLVARSRAVADPSISLLAVSARAAAGAIYRDASGAALTREAFFAKAAGRRILLRGSPTAEGIAASVLEIEP